MLQDIRLAFRQLGKSPVFTAVVLATLALGIGANTTIFSLVNSVLIKPLPYPEADRIVQVGSSVSTNPFRRHYNADTARLLFDEAESYDSLTLVTPTTTNVIQGGRAQKINQTWVSAGFLKVFGIQPMLGRDFLPGEDDKNANKAIVILTHAFWKTHFASDPTVVGQTLSLGSVPHEVVGVLPPNALPHVDTAVLVPVAIDDAPWKTNPTTAWIELTGRLKPGVSLVQANTELTTFLEARHRTNPTSPEAGRGASVPFQQHLLGPHQDVIPLLLGAVVLVLLVAGANVANLLLARATTRRKEMAVRAALGAGQGRLMRQVLIESLVLGLIGGGLGVLVSSFSIDFLALAMPVEVPSVMHPELDVGVLLFSVVVACGTGLLVGFVPAWRAGHTDLNRDLSDGGRGSTAGGRTKIQSALVIGEVALTVVLLVASGLLLRSYTKTLQAEQGFQAEHVIMGRLSLDMSKFTAPGGVFPKDIALNYHRELRRELAALPGVTAVGTAWSAPFENRIGGRMIRAADKPNPEDALFTIGRPVGGEYFRALGIRLISGRFLTEDDERGDAPTVGLVNERLAAQLFPGQDPIGREVVYSGQTIQIVGIVSNVRLQGMNEEFRPMFYQPHITDPWNISLILRSSQSPELLANAMREVVTRVDPDQALYDVRTIQSAMVDTVAPQRVTLMLVAVFGASALALACLGIYGVMAYSIEQRKRELSIRMALGAVVSDILKMVMRDGARLGAWGVGLGSIGGLVGARLIEAQLFEISANDPTVFASVIGIIAVLIWGSVLIPAKRATKANPADVLRND